MSSQGASRPVEQCSRATTSADAACIAEAARAFQGRTGRLLDGVDTARVERRTRGEVCLLGRGVAEIADAMSRLERSARTSVHTMQRRVPFLPGDPFSAANRRARVRSGVELQLIVSPSGYRDNPFIPCIQPTARVGPVVAPMLVIDETTVVVGGPHTSAGEITAWSIGAGDLVTQARELWQRTLAASRPCEDLQLFSARQYAIACLTTLGRPDTQIARALGVSVRTVTGELQLIRRALGVTSRAALIARLASVEP